MKKIAEALGMGEPKIAEYEIDDQAMSVFDNGDVEEYAQNGGLEVNDEKEEKLIDTGYAQLEDIIKDTMSNAKHLTEVGRDFEPRSRARIYEVGAQYYKAALDAIKQKQVTAQNSQDYKFKKATTGAPLNGIANNTQNNHFYGSREEVLKMLKEGKKISEGNDNEDDS